MRMLVALTVVMAVSVRSAAQTTVNEWNVNDTSKWSFNQGILTITQTDADTFCFEAYASGSPGTPANIDQIVVANNLGGTVRLSVLQNPGNSPATTRGAASVRIIDLSEADTGEVVSLDLSGNLGMPASP